MIILKSKLYEKFIFKNFKKQSYNSLLENFRYYICDPKEESDEYDNLNRLRTIEDFDKTRWTIKNINEKRDCRLLDLFLKIDNDTVKTYCVFNCFKDCAIASYLDCIFWRPKPVVKKVRFPKTKKQKVRGIGKNTSRRK